MATSPAGTSRSTVRWRLLPLAVVVMGVVWAFGMAGYLGIPLSVELYRVAVSLYMLVLLTVELLETQVHLKTLQLRPSLTFLLSFVFLVLVGAGLFMLPKMTNEPGSMRFIDALFMSASASCVTGLAVVDPGVGSERRPICLRSRRAGDRACG